MDVHEKIKRAEERTNTVPTDGQKLSGNYAKGKLTIKGFNLSIENPVGSIRSGIDSMGRPWSNTIKNTYGYFRGTRGKDGDPIDVYLGPDIATMFDVYVIDQIDPITRAFDEHKVMLGFESKEAAQQAYLNNYEPEWKGLGAITAISLNKFKNWLFSPKLTLIPISKMNAKIGIKGAVNAEAGGRICHVLMMEEVIENVTLKNLQAQMTSDYDMLVLEIGSPGGSVLEGMKIMKWLDELSRQGKIITTIVTANAYSIASLIMLVAHQRFISIHGQVMVHNPMIPEITYANAEELEANAKEMRQLEDGMRSLYCMFTGLDESKVKELMDNETYLSPEDTVKYGFADKIVEVNKKPYITAVKAIKYKIKDMKKAMNILRRVISLIDGADVVNQLYSTSTGTDIEIYQLDPSRYQEGDRTNVESGEITIAADGNKLLIDDYVIKQIVSEVEDPEEEVTDPLEPLETNEPDEPPMAFNQGPAPKAEDVPMDPIPAPVEPASVDPIPAPEIVPAPVPQAMPQPAVPAQPIIPAPGQEELIGLVKKMQATIDKLTKEVGELQTEKVQRQLTDMQSKSSMKEIEMKLSSFEEFESMAAEAIDTLCSNTETVWKKDIKAVAKPTETSGSIFKDSLRKRGLASK